jgi:hypothetical protein
MDYQKLQQEIELQELTAICNEIRSYGSSTVQHFEQVYGTALEKIKLRTLLILLRNLREMFKGN